MFSLNEYIIDRKPYINSINIKSITLNPIKDIFNLAVNHEVFLQFILVLELLY